MRKLINLFSILLTILLSGCVSNISTQPEKLPGLDIRTDEMNKAFVIKTSSDFESNYIQNHWLIFVLKNNSEDDISIDGRNVKIFHKKQNEWVQINNLMGYPSVGFFLQSKKDFPLSEFIYVIPDFCQLTHKEEIRIVIIGKILQSQKKVAAYKDLLIINGATPNETFCQK